MGTGFKVPVQADGDITLYFVCHKTNKLVIACKLRVGLILINY